jgi:hypothetical protein
LRHHRIIRPILAGWLLALFALAITPKIAIHALVAHHTDSHVTADVKTDLVNKAGFHCDTENLVVEMPFMHFPLAMAIGVPPCFPLHRAAVPQSPLCLTHPLYGLRGPPALLSI